MTAGSYAVAKATFPAAPHGAQTAVTTVRIGLAGTDPDGLRRFALAVSDPANSRYRHFLSPEEVRQRFGPTGSQLEKVHAWVSGAGLRITGENSHWIDAAGTQQQVAKAFAPTLARPRQRTEGLAAEAAATVPDGLAGVVSSVAGLGPERHGVRQLSHRVGPARGLRGLDRADRPDWPDRLDRQNRPDRPNPGGPMRMARHAGSADTTPDAPADDSPGPPSDGASDAPPADSPGAPVANSPDVPPATSPGACSPGWGTAPAAGFPAGYQSPEHFAPCAYVPSQLRAAYGITASGLTGKGAVIGIVDAYGSPTMRADADRYATSVGDKPFRDGQYIETVDREHWRHIGDGLCETPATWGGEQALDIELAHGLAPDATVHYFGAASCDDHDIAGTLAQIVDQRSADTVTGAFGEIMHTTTGTLDPSLVEQEDKLFTIGTAEGIGFSFASGDCADQAPGLVGPSCDPSTARPQTEWPASSPWVTAVGGTALAASPAGRRQWEVAMGDARSDLAPDGKTWQPFPGAFYFGGGGGTSEDFAQPPYQGKAVPDALAHTVAGKHGNTAMRTVPDVAFNGDLLTAVLTGHTDPTLGGYTTDEVGGTSAAVPMFAAVQAIAAQAAGGRLGFANPALYQRAGTKQFNDVVERPAGAPDPISAVVDHGTTDGMHEARLYRLGADHGLSAGAGYDVATGLGSVTADYFASYKPVVKPVPPALPVPVPPTAPTTPKPTPPQTPKPTPAPKPTPPSVPAPKPTPPTVPTVPTPKPGPPK
ncbi:MAG: hypothetical protein HOV83_30585, partial [Catenulispora sp.]|nr:hypothetical protein [Catenulispora sp.]